VTGSRKRVALDDNAQSECDIYLCLKQRENLGGCPNDDVWPIRKQDSNDTFPARYRDDYEKCNRRKRTVAAAT
jgi:hypothetical protein